MAAQSAGRMQPLGSSLRPAPTASRGLQAPATSSLPKTSASSQRPLPPPSCSAVSLPPSRRPLLCLSPWLILSLPPQHGCSSQEHQALSLFFLHPTLREFGAFLQRTNTECPLRPSLLPGASNLQYRLPPGHLWEHPRGSSHSNIQHPAYLLSLSKASANF